MPGSRLILSAVVSGLLAVSCSSVDSVQGRGESSDGGARTGEFEVEPIEWRDCTDEIAPLISGAPGAERDVSFGCSRIAVPLDHADAGGETIDVQVLRVRSASQTDRIGSLVVNPGGPGGSGLDAAIGLGLMVSEPLLNRFDIVGFDPRGVGLSTPIECISDDLTDQLFAAATDAQNEEEFQQHKELANDIKEGCQEENGDRLEYFNTVATAQDMELLRQALGEDKLNYLGFSYGTILGATYADLYPQQIRSMVLDGAIDPTLDYVSSIERQVAGFEDAFHQFAEDCTSQGADCPLNPDPQSFVIQLMNKAAAQPIPSSEPGEERQATEGNVQVAVASALYDNADWPALAAALADADKGDAHGVFELNDDYSHRDDNGQYPNIFDVSIAVNCNDAETFNEALVRTKLAEWRTQYPIFGASQALGLLPCLDWPADHTKIPEIDAPGSPAIVVVGTTHDPATPYSGAVSLANELESGSLLTWEGDGHTAYLRTECIDRAVNDYLINLTIPSEGASCPAD